MEALLDWVRHLPGIWQVLFLAMLPISELRGAIPFAVFVKSMGYTEAYFLAVLGNFIPVIPLLLLLGPLERWLGRWRIWRRFFDWLFARSRRRGKLIDRFKFLGLVLFVGIPLPITGAWTGIAAAHVFGVPFRRALPAVTLGIMLAGLVVSLACAGVLSFWGLVEG